jgi:hypothetical protein
MQEQEGRSWFAIDGDSLRVAFECDERLRGPLESMSGELVDFRLAAHARIAKPPNEESTCLGAAETGVKNGQLKLN